MEIESLVLIILVVVGLINQGVQMYIHFEAYPLFKFVGNPEFAIYIKQYEDRLTVPLLLPYGITVLSNIALIFLHPEPISVIAIIVLLVLNLSVAGISLQVATPIYEKIKAAGTADSADMAQLMQINLLRLGITSAASLMLAGFLAAILP